MEMCNQVTDKECYNQDGSRCQGCEYQSLCLCTKTDRPFVSKLDKAIARKVVVVWLATDPPLDSSDIGMLIGYLEE